MMKDSRDKIYIKTSKIHQRGIFARKNIEKDIPVVQYTGRKLTKKQSDRSNSWYIFEVNKRFDIEGRNIARYMNHSCDPNCEAYIVNNNEVWIYSLRSIERGEELTYNYGYEADSFEDYLCNCLAKNCIGYMLDQDHWHIVRKAKKKTKK